jgi:putative ABC transport system permease protein
LDDVEGGEGVYEVLGVMPSDFTYPVGAARATDIWVPYVVPADQRVRDPASRSSYLQVIARLKPGVSITQAQAQMNQVAAALEAANPVWNKDNRIGVRPLIDHMVGSRTKSWMLMLLGAVGIVLLIACANVANLLLARASAREREVGIRAALGAGRWRLVRQLMIESLLLSLAGTACAVLAAWWGVELLRASLPDNLPRVSSIAVNFRVLAAAAGLAVMTGVLCGIVPALQLSRPDLSSALKDGARGSAGAGRRRLRSGLVVVEVALAVVLLVAAALFIGSFVSAMNIDTGFDATNVLTAQISPPIESRRAPRTRALELTDIVDRIAQLPGVVHASLISGGLPLAGGMSITTLRVPGRRLDLNTDQGVSIRNVTPEYHSALKIPLRRGRLFQRSDREGSAPVIILNESAAKKYFPNESPVGRTVTLNGDRTVVGIVGDVRQTSLEVDPRAEAYVPVAQGHAVSGDLVIRTSGDPYEVLPGVKAAVLAVLPDVPVRNVTTMETILSKRLAQRRLNMLLMGLFGLLGLVISAVGIYGVMAYVVSQRTREIGVRMALGATPWDVVLMVLRNAAALVVAGLTIGAAAAWYLSAAARTFLFHLEPTDVRAYVAPVLLLSAAALAASAIPARRAARVDPMVALRAE